MVCIALSVIDRTPRISCQVFAVASVIVLAVAVVLSLLPLCFQDLKPRRLYILQTVALFVAGELKLRFCSVHCSDVIISAMASQITGVLIVCSTLCSGANQTKTSKLRLTGLCEGNPPVNSGFPSQMASNGKTFPFDDVIIKF